MNAEGQIIMPEALAARDNGEIGVEEAIKHVAQKRDPVLTFSNMRTQTIRARRVNANERDML